MKKLLKKIFDLIFPRRENDAAIARLSPEVFWAEVPRWNMPIYPYVRAIFRYKDRRAEAVVKELKESRNIHAARIAGSALASLLEDLGIRQAIIVPLPLSKKRRRKRGYNQCELIVEFFMKEINTRSKERSGKTGGQSPEDRSLHFEVRTDILRRITDGPKSALQGRAGRLRAAEGAFEVSCTLSHIEWRIIIIDDVVTTGSTMNEAVKCLRHAGARNACGIGLAH
jgi:predicted amidophosphoribosyltransferase